MPLYVADYLGDTMHLTTEQHGAYLLLLMATWRSGGRLPNDPSSLASIAKLSARAWTRSAPTVLAFFQPEGAWLSHKRVTEEITRAEHLIEVRRQNGMKGGRPPKLNGTEIEPRGKLQVIGSKS